MTGFCLICGRIGSVQFHHLAGRVYAPSLGAPACRRCHTYLHGRLAAGGIDLRHASLVPGVRAWAVLRGTSETFAASLVILNKHAQAAALRAWARQVSLSLVQRQEVCEQLSPRPLSGVQCPRPVRRQPAVDRAIQATELLELAHAAARSLDRIDDR
jgi:hypothetical protein